MTENLPGIYGKVISVLLIFPAFQFLASRLYQVVLREAQNTEFFYLLSTFFAGFRLFAPFETMALLFE